MKTKITLLTLLLISLNINAQINKYDTKKPSLSVKPTTTLKLPLLNATSLDRFSYGKIENRIRQLSPKRLVTIAAREYAKNAGALNVTLSTNNVRNAYAGLKFKGTFDDNRIKIESKYNDFFGIYFRARKNKTYRVKLRFDLNFNSAKCRNPMLFINMGGKSQALEVEKGKNGLDFLVKSEFDGRILFFPLTKLGFQCQGQNYRENDLEYQFVKTEIQELQD